MNDRRAKYEAQQMLRYLADGTPISPRTSPRSPDLSQSDDILRGKYDELNRLMLSHIAQRKTLGHIYSSYDLDFRKADYNKQKMTEKENRKLKKSAKGCTEIVDQDNRVRLKVWEMPSDSEDVESSTNNEYRDEISEDSEGTCNSTVNSTLTIHEVNTDGEEIDSADDENTSSGFTKSKRVSFKECKEEKLDSLYDPNSLETLLLKDILRSQKKLINATDSGVHPRNKSTKGNYKFKAKKKSPRQRRNNTSETEGLLENKDSSSLPNRSPRQKSKCALDNHLDSSSNPDVRMWIRDKNKLARKKLKEQRRKERRQLEKEGNDASENAARLIESEEKVKTWIQDKHKQVLLQRKLKQRVEEIQKRNAAIKNTDELHRRNNQREQFEFRKMTIRRRQIRIKKRQEEQEDDTVRENDENQLPLDPSFARLLDDEKLQAREAKRKYGVSVRGTLKKASQEMKKCNQSGNNDDQELKVKTPNGRLSRSKQKETKGSNIGEVDNSNVVDRVNPVDLARKTNRKTYNAWIKIKRDEDNVKKKEDATKKKADSDLEVLLPTLSKERIRRATESKKTTDTGSPRNVKSPSRKSGSIAQNRPQSAINVKASDRIAATTLPQRPGSARIQKSDKSQKSLKKDELKIVLEGERPEPQGCEIPDDSFCQTSSAQSTRTVTTDNDIGKKHSTNFVKNTELEILNTDNVFITA